MVRPILDDQPALRQRLLHVMTEIEYPHCSQHEAMIENAIIFECSDEGKIAGYLWFYRILNQEHIWTVHMLVLNNFRKRFFNRSLVNSICGTVYALGCDIVRAENDFQDWLIRLKGNQFDGYVDLSLPFCWRL